MIVREFTFTATITVTGVWDDESFPGDSIAKTECGRGASYVLHHGDTNVTQQVYEEDLTTASEIRAEVIDLN